MMRNLVEKKKIKKLEKRKLIQNTWFNEHFFYLIVSKFHSIYRITLLYIWEFYILISLFHQILQKSTRFIRSIYVKCFVAEFCNKNDYYNFDYWRIAFCIRNTWSAYFDQISKQMFEEKKKQSIWEKLLVLDVNTFTIQRFKEYVI